MKPEKLQDLKDINLGDVLDISLEGSYGHATVKCINPDGSIQMFRPYVVCGDFSYTGGVLVSVGIEDFTIGSGPVIRVEVGKPLK